jgi:hypothetical protein
MSHRLANRKVIGCEETVSLLVFHQKHIKSTIYFDNINLSTHLSSINIRPYQARN